MDWVSLILTIITCVSISLLTWCWNRRPQPPPRTELPPKPPASSIFGHLQLRHPKFHRGKALEWAKKYGPVFRLRIFFTNVVVLNDFDSIKKFCVDNQTLYRPDILNFGRDYYQGLDEFSKVTEAIEKAAGEPLCLVGQFMEFSAMNVASFFMGPWTEINSEVRYQLVDILKRNFIVLQSAEIYQFWPRILRSLLQMIPSTSNHKINSVFRDLDNFIVTDTDLVVDRFYVPRGTVVLFNMWAVNRDPSLWKDPHHFNPSRFMRQDGTWMPHKPNCHVGFSFGMVLRVHVHCL
ncbi:hypothetical protein HPB50_018723 [Hyalomma asiaticum]|uniref:Uncharacterized protein n=1 Tax=Hyalomma asiaticum TaxID=266040 RepID=A0ACB7RYG9_HYAAI|nr:hypothetical protein HPB50_018723 [Hyalomma asiaticum]